MREREVLVRFRPSGAETYVLPGTRLVEAAAEAGVLIDVPCGGEGLCGACRVIIRTGACEPTAIERERLSDEELACGWRLACQSAVCGPTEVEVPRGASAADHQIFVDAPGHVRPADDPPVRKRYVELPPPTRGDDAPDAARLERALGVGPLDISLPLLCELPTRLRENGFRGTAVLADQTGAALASPAVLLDFEAGNTESDAYAVAVDLGTTTLVGELLDLRTGQQRAVVSRLNPQTRFGDDVVSRIVHVRQHPDGLTELRDVIRSAIAEIIGELCAQAGVSRNRVYEATVAGNTTMQQLFCGVDPSPLGEMPFVPAVGHAVRCAAAELGLPIHPRGIAYVMPVIGGFVGGDTVAGLLATGMADGDGPVLFVDIGTNGEIALLAKGQLVAASTAAGPAFEGARISCGMRGATGAIEKVVVDGCVRINVIGDVAPVGLCGSGLIDVAAELLRHGLLTSQGRLKTPDELGVEGDSPIVAETKIGTAPDRRHDRPNVPVDLARRIQLHEGQVSFLLADGAETADGRPIVLTQRDLRELQLATGAIRAGIAILLHRVGLKSTDLAHVLVGGGFGNFIRRNNAQRIGLLPGQVERSRIRYLGNTSLAGARLSALSQSARCTAERLARRTEHVDLSSDPAFAREFAEAMIFPEEAPSPKPHYAHEPDGNPPRH
ncbi:MAG: ASKHA domain-containing protein [Thermoguttaceae bacterium]